MKKLTTLLTSFVMVFLFVGVVNAKVERVAGDWVLNAPNSIDFTCGGGTYEHTLDEVTNENGTFEGVGSYDANDSYTWDIEGTVNGDDLTFTLVYTGTNAGYTLNGEGMIYEDGSVTGTTDGNCQEFAMPEGTATRFMGNHGQWVRMSENKMEVAQSRVGMPLQSRGHMK